MSESVLPMFSSSFIYLCLDVLVLCCCVGFFLVGASGDYSCWGAQASRCCGLSSLSMGSRVHRLQQFLHVGSVVVAPRLQSTGLTVVVQLLSCPSAWYLPRLGIKPMYSTLADGFFTTESPLKPPNCILFISYLRFLSHCLLQ